MGIMTTISVIIIAIIFITDHWLWSSEQVGTVSHPKVQTLSNRTPDGQPAIAMEGGAADRNHSGEGQGNPHHREPQGGRGDTMGWGGGGGA